MDLSCPICHYRFSSIGLLEKHRKNARKTCAVCKKTLCSRISMETHSRHCLSPDTRQCNKCLKKFADFDTLLWHVEENNCWNPELNRHCQACFFCYSHDAAYEEHLSWCSTPSTTVTGVQAKQNTHNAVENSLNGNQFQSTGSKCLFCAKYFSSSLDMLKHLQWHMPSIMIKCKECPAYFMDEQDLTEHANLHLASPTKRIRSPPDNQELHPNKKVKLEKEKKTVFELETNDEETEDWIIEEVPDEEENKNAPVPLETSISPSGRTKSLYGEVDKEIAYEPTLFFGKTVLRKVSTTVQTKIY